MLPVLVMYSDYLEWSRNGYQINIVKVIRELLGASWEDSQELARKRFWENGNDTVSVILQTIEEANAALSFTHKAISAKGSGALVPAYWGADQEQSVSAPAVLHTR